MTISVQRYAHKIRKFHVQVVQRTQELRNVSKLAMHLQTVKLFGFLNQSPFFDVLVAVAFADEKAVLCCLVLNVHVERKHSIQGHPTIESHMVFSISILRL